MSTAVLQSTEISIETLVNDRVAFNNFIYTPLSTALAELEQRANNEQLEKYISALPAGLPQELREKKFAVIFRPIATPDFDFRRFASIVEMIPELQPLVLEYHEDRYLNRNDCKFALGKVCFNTGKSKKGEMLFTNKVIIDVNDANKKKISEVKTHWGERLIDFHHDLLKNEYLDKTKQNIKTFDASAWLHRSGGVPEQYYKSFLSLFLKDAILFENFMLNENEYEFTKSVVLPAFIKIYQETGHKPLVVALQPTEIEGERFWLSHPGESISYIEKKLLI